MVWRLKLGLLGLAVRACLGLAGADLFSSGFSRLARVVTVAAVAGLAGACIGRRRARAGRKPLPVFECHREAPPPAERDVLVALHVCDPQLAERTAALLRGLGAERVDLFDAHGTRLSPEALHPRPADPDSW